MLKIGSGFTALRGARREPLKRPTAELTITLHLRFRGGKAVTLEKLFEEIQSGRRNHLTRAEFTQTFGASRRDIAQVRRFARSHGFRVSDVSIAKRTMNLSGPGSRLAAAFGVNRVRYRMGDTAWNSFIGHVYLAPAVADVVVGVFGFDQRPELARRGGESLATHGTKPKVSYNVPHVARLYGFPDDLDGKGQSVAIIALGGGYRNSDLRTYFRAMRLPMPRIRSRSVDGARNAPGGETAQFDGEVTGDLETVGALAPRARITVYFAPNTAQGFLEGVAAAVHDARARNSVISISWGQAEVHWHHNILLAFNQVLLEAAILGVSVCCSSGDFGAFADARDRVPHVNFPGSSPYVLSCGGTTLLADGETIESERVWHNKTGASGGGVSAIFPRPRWQRRVRVPRAKDGRAMRGVPDVAANADPLTGYRIFVNGHWVVGAGTSASSPLWAGLLARINQLRGSAVGLPTPLLYERFGALIRQGAVVPVTQGNNGLFHATNGWSCCTGVGSPRGAKLARALARAKRGA
jgi:kumamolisin